MSFVIDPTKHSQESDDIFWRDEILQVMYWYKGEGFGEIVCARDLQTFLTADETFLNRQLERLVGEGYLKKPAEDELYFTFTKYGEREGARRFADEFSELLSQGHGDCPPDCPHCKDVARDSCIHCSPN